MGDIVTGVDSSSACTAESLACVQGEGMAFVGRYYSRTTQIAGKKLTASEAQLFVGAGLLIVAVYEDGPTEASYFSVSRGTEDAQGAMQQAQAVGQPQGTPIYFTVDYDASSSDIAGAITAYFGALNDTFNGVYEVGVYGSGAVCSAILAAGLAKLAWLAQSTGWSGYSQFTDWAIKQGASQAICGLNSDSDVAHGEYGGFQV